ncbi:MAG: DUF305 domain-containing protein [Wenzhouxiangellaceae bacterium]|nr:DUF305 domain-containing protein [Wenzhouxiangellaceae bacterium]MBS3745785.1 DUF305 domain-containing protein [Wenzhouxiangellaceae bacterium]
MTSNQHFTNRFSRAALMALASTFAAASALAQVSIINPGAPGQASRELAADEASRLAGTRYTEADVRFMQDMIPHHHQALVMSRLVPERTNRNELIEVAERIETSQADEIAFMQDWLRVRGEDVPDPAAHQAMHMSHEMAGMATPAQMAELEAAEGAEFDRLFLSLMIEHHEGALTMVEDLLDEPGAAYEPVLFEFTTDITSDQSAEIERMTVMLAGYSADPRVGLAGGLHDAGQASMNLELLAALPKPDGFFDPENPAGLPLEQLMAEAEGDEGKQVDEPEAGEEVAAARDEDDDEDDRSPPLSFANTDMAFDGDVLVAGNYHGFNIYDIGNGADPELLSSVVCPGGQGDVSIVGDLLIMSVEQTRARLDCGLQGTTGEVSDERFLGVRIFDIGNLRMPRQVGAVQTCRGSHTHSVVSADDERVIVYNSGLRDVRDEEELAGCIDESRYGDERTALFRIDVIEIPVDDPSSARIVDSPAVFADPEAGTLAGLWMGGDHGEDTQETNETDHCHDITVFPDKNIAAGACSGNGILFDISDPMNPTRIDEVVDESFAYWHSATFNNDATKVIFTDEWGGGSRPRCRASDPMTWGADAIFDIVDGQLEFRGYFKMPAPQSEEENCVAHNGSIIPVPGRDIFVQAWYQGGVSVIDFTDSANAVEIAYFDRGPVFEEELVMGGYWSTYWFDGLIYGTEIARGLDVLALVPGEHLSENEIAAASATIGGALFNPQQQFPITWKPEPVVARAYVDQLQRSQALPAAQITAVSAALDGARAQFEAGTRDPSLADELDGIAAELASEGVVLEGADRRRLAGLGETLAGIAERLR